MAFDPSVFDPAAFEQDQQQDGLVSGTTRAYQGPPVGDVSGAFRLAADDPQNRPAKRFTYPEGVNDYTNKLMDMGSIDQIQFEGDPLNAADVTVELINDSKEFNAMITDKTKLGKIGKLELGFNGEYFGRYRGYLTDIEYYTEERPKVKMTFSSTAQRAIEQTIGSPAAPVDYYSAGPKNPASLAFTLLTAEGGLDPLLAPANRDIDYTTWQNFYWACEAFGYRLQGYFTGETIAEAIRIIGQLTDTVIYAEADGRFYFKRLYPVAGILSTPYLFTEDSAHLQAARLYFNKQRLVNDVTVWAGYDPIGGAWATSATRSDAASQATYGIVTRTFNSTAVWHSNFRSADAFAERLVLRYATPPETVSFKVKQGTQAMLMQIADNIRLTWSQVDYALKVFLIYGISSRLTTQECQITAEEDKNFATQYFFWDDPVQGAFDGANQFI